jgi:hypothetical protein
MCKNLLTAIIQREKEEKFLKNLELPSPEI